MDIALQERLGCGNKHLEFSLVHVLDPVSERGLLHQRKGAVTAQRIAARFGVKLENIVGLCGVEIVLRRKSVLGEFKRLEALGAQFTDFVVQSFVLGDVFRNHALTRRENDRVDIGNSVHGPEKFLRRFFPVISEFGLDNFFEAAGFEIDCAQHSGRIHGKGNGFGVVHGTTFSV